MGDGEGGLGGDIDPGIDHAGDGATHVVVHQPADHGIILDGDSGVVVLPPPVRLAHPPQPVPDPDDDEDD